MVSKSARKSKRRAPPAEPPLEKKVVTEESSSSTICEPLFDNPISENGTLTTELRDHWESIIVSNPKLVLSRTIFNQTELEPALHSRPVKINNPFVFNTGIRAMTGYTTDSESSGADWLFAATNILRPEVIKKLNLSGFSFSISYLLFWHKLNKCNHFLELMIRHVNSPLDDRLVYTLLSEPISNDGLWDMAVELFETYGLVPEGVFPATCHFDKPSQMDKLLKFKVREHAMALRALATTIREESPDIIPSEKDVLARLRAKKEVLLKDCYTILSACLGVVPLPKTTFVWEYADADGVARSWEGTPKGFYELVASTPYSLTDTMCLVSNPIHEYEKRYTIENFGGCWGGRSIQFVNCHIEELKNSVVKMVKAGHPVVLSCDVWQSSEDNIGLLDPDLYDISAAFDFGLNLSTADRIRVGAESRQHVVVWGVHLDTNTGRPLRYKVENSWGANYGRSGWYAMTDKWFDKYVQGIVVFKHLASKELVKIYDGEISTVLPIFERCVCVNIFRPGRLTLTKMCSAKSDGLSVCKLFGIPGRSRCFCVYCFHDSPLCIDKYL